MSRRRTLVAAVIAAFTIVAIPISASARVTAGSATFVDPAGDAAGAPDISAVTVAHDDAGTLAFRIAVSDRTALVLGDQAFVFLNVDERLDTGATDYLGADVLLQLFFDGSFWMRRWNGSTFPLEASPSASLTAGWSEGYRFSIALAELGSLRRIAFLAGTFATPGGLSARDQLIGGYDTQTGEAIDPLPEPPPTLRLPARRRVCVHRAHDATGSGSRGRRAPAHRSTRSGGRARGVAAAFASARPPPRSSWTSVSPAASPTTTLRELGTPTVGAPLAPRCSAPGVSRPDLERPVSASLDAGAGCGLLLSPAYPGTL